MSADDDSALFYLAKCTIFLFYSALNRVIRRKFNLKAFNIVIDISKYYDKIQL